MRNKSYKTSFENLLYKDIIPLTHENVNIFFTTKRSYNHLTAQQRAQIDVLIHERYSLSKIADILRCHKSTISREIKRGSVSQKKMINDYKEVVTKVYFSDTAQQLANKRKQHSIDRSKFNKTSQQFVQSLITAVTKKIRLHSIDTFVHVYKQQYPNDYVPCTKTIYTWIHQQRLSLKPIDLPRMVRLRKKATAVRQQTHKRYLGTSIDYRPQDVASRLNFGHWEIDLIIGKRTK